MRRCRSTKQCVWLGSCRYPCWGGRRYTDADADCHSDGDRHANSQPHRNRNGIADSYAATDANPKVGAIGKAAPHPSAQALDFVIPEISGVR